MEHFTKLPVTYKKEVPRLSISARAELNDVPIMIKTLRDTRTQQNLPKKKEIDHQAPKKVKTLEKFKPIVFKRNSPSKKDIPQISTICDDPEPTVPFEKSENVPGENGLMRQEIEDKVKRERVKEKQRIAAKYFKVLGDLKINKSFLADVNRYPMNSQSTLDHSVFDEVELKLVGEILMTTIDK